MLTGIRQKSATQWVGVGRLMEAVAGLRPEGGGWDMFGGKCGRYEEKKLTKMRLI